MHNAWRFVQHGRRTVAVSAASALGLQQYYQHSTTTFCGATDQDIPPIAGFQEGKETPATTSSYKSKVHEEWYHGMFPKRQLWRPKLEYPLWDPDWDHKHNDDLSSEEKRNLRVRGVTRHIILVRHGQYDESYRVSHFFDDSMSRCRRKSRQTHTCTASTPLPFHRMMKSVS
jgi:hypothetical protein